MNSLIPLVDADIIVYRAACAAQHKRYHAHESDWYFDSWAEAKEYIEATGGAIECTELIVEPVENALHNAKSMLSTIEDKFSVLSNELVLFLTETNDETSFRKKLAKTKEYKSSRKKQDKPQHYQAVRDYLNKHYRTETIKGYEADDALGIYHTANPSETVVCSIDKDLLQVPGKHYNIVHQTHFVIDELTGARNLFQQILSGDPSDDIPGCPKIGKIGAIKILKDCSDIKGMYDVTKARYRDCGYGNGIEDRLEFMLEQANLCFIFRETGITFSKWIEKYL